VQIAATLGTLERIGVELPDSRFAARKYVMKQPSGAPNTDPIKSQTPLNETKFNSFGKFSPSESKMAITVVSTMIRDNFRKHQTKVNKIVNMAGHIKRPLIKTGINMLATIEYHKYWNEIKTPR
jgi:hypothetical protein